jgi:hypothetical protein
MEQEICKIPGATAFEEWFVACVEHAVCNHLGPDDYLWDLQNPGVWADLRVAGLSPSDAVKSQFCKH